MPRLGGLLESRARRREIAEVPGQDARWRAAIGDTSGWCAARACSSALRAWLSRPISFSSLRSCSAPGAALSESVQVLARRYARMAPRSMPASSSSTPRLNAAHAVHSGCPKAMASS
jgi:hypothetical protein